MKKIIFFDLDNTLHSTQDQKIPEQTIKLMKKIASMPNTYLGLATGRGPSKVQMLDPYKDLFTYWIFVNGAIAYKKDELIYDNPLKREDIERVLKIGNNRELSIGMVSNHGEYVTYMDETVDTSMKNFGSHIPTVDPLAYLKVPVYQLWLFTSNQPLLDKIVKENKALLCYPWHHGGADLVDPSTNKAIAIEKLLKDEGEYELITVGDGHNDIKMIELADIGIAMENSRFDELKEKADFIAPHVDKDQLYDLFKELKIID